MSNLFRFFCCISSLQVTAEADVLDSFIISFSRMCLRDEISCSFRALYFWSCAQVTAGTNVLGSFSAFVINFVSKWLREQGWEHLSSTNVARVRFPHPVSYVDWVRWFSTLLWEVFPRALRFSPHIKNQHLIWFVNTDCKMMIWAMLIWFPLEL